jgi:hypothetical protein
LGVGQLLDGLSQGSNGKADELLQQMFALLQQMANKDTATDKNPVKES